MLDVQGFGWTKGKWYKLSFHSKYKMEIIDVDLDLLEDFKS